MPDVVPTSLPGVWDSLKEGASDYQVSPSIHLAHIFEVVEALDFPDVVLLQEVDKRCLETKELLLSTGFVSQVFVAGDEQSLSGVVDRGDHFSTAHEHDYVAFFGSTSTKDPDNSVILVRASKVKSVKKIENASPRHLRVILDMEVRSATSSSAVVKTVRLGSYHFSSGHASTQKEFDDNIFELRSSGAGETMLELLGGDLNTEPERDAYLLEAEPRVAGRNKNKLVRVTNGGATTSTTTSSSTSSGGVTYAKKLSVLQPQMTKADKIERQSIDHVYARGFKTLVVSGGDQKSVSHREEVELLPQRVHSIFEEAAKAAGYEDSDAVFSSDGSLAGLLEREGAMLNLPISGHPLFRSDHMPIYFRVEPILDESGGPKAHL
ncbi:unnamed protein product [Amoebophrya sp. A25]|nr:unnamed protein product [Amoebophrya sp. A25]|eukprot:GSA25T00009684001.1